METCAQTPCCARLTGRWQRWLLLWLLLVALAAGPAMAGAQDNSNRLDVRVVLDNSPAAAAADPQGLRLQAVAALARFLPGHARAGIWVAGERPLALLPPGPVDAAWRQAASNLTLPETPQRANLADALAALAQLPVDPSWQTHLVLVGQGSIAVSDNTVWNRALRQGVLSDTLPALAAMDVRVHTLALDGTADLELLSTLALVSSGQHQVVGDGAALETALREALGIRAETEQVAIAGQPFEVPPGTRVVHVLMTTAADQGRLRPEIETPQGQRLQAEMPAPNLRWHRAPGQLLLTATDPPAGTWQVHPAGRQPVAVRTLLDPAMQIGAVPGSAMAGHAQRVDLALVAEGARVTDPPWLDLFAWTALLAQPDGDLRRLPVKPVQRPDDGLWWIDLAGFAAPGAYRLDLRLQTPTFQLEADRQVLVDAALGLAFSTRDNLGVLTLDLAPDGLQPDSVRIIARVVQPDTRMVMVPSVRRGNRHELLLKPPLPGNEQLRPGFSVDLTVRGTLADGSAFELRPDRLNVPWPFPDKPVLLSLSVGHPAFPPLPGQQLAAETAPGDQAVVATAGSPFGAPQPAPGFGPPAAEPTGADAAPVASTTEAAQTPALDPATAPEPGLTAEEEPLLPTWLVLALIIGNNVLVFAVGIVLFRRKPTTPPIAETLAAAIDGVAAARDALASGQHGPAAPAAAESEPEATAASDTDVDAEPAAAIATAAEPETAAQAESTDRAVPDGAQDAEPSAQEAQDKPRAAAKSASRQGGGSADDEAA